MTIETAPPAATPADRLKAIRAYSEKNGGADRTPTVNDAFNHHFSGLISALILERFPNARYAFLHVDDDEEGTTIIGDIQDADTNVIKAMDDTEWQSEPVGADNLRILDFVWELPVTDATWVRDGIEKLRRDEYGPWVRIDLVAAAAAPVAQ